LLPDGAIGIKCLNWSKDCEKEIKQFLVSSREVKKVFSIFDSKLDPESVMKKFESTKKWQKDQRVRKIFEKDLEGLKNSQILILLLPAGKSAHIEAGIAYGLGKKCILIGDQKKAESHYLIFDEFYPTIEAFLKSL